MQTRTKNRVQRKVSDTIIRGPGYRKPIKEETERDRRIARAAALTPAVQDQMRAEMAAQADAVKAYGEATRLEVHNDGTITRGPVVEEPGDVEPAEPAKEK
jgi:hypothetical protein